MSQLRTLGDISGTADVGLHAVLSVLTCSSQETNSALPFKQRLVSQDDKCALLPNSHQPAVVFIISAY